MFAYLQVCLFVYSITPRDDNKISREHQNLYNKEMIPNLGVLGSISWILEQFFSYITIEINYILCLIPCKQISGSQTD